MNEQLLLERIALLEKRVADLEQQVRNQQPFGPITPTYTSPLSDTGYCTFCFRYHNGQPCPNYVVTCNTGV
jgi:hypothetical protein